MHLGTVYLVKNLKKKKNCLRIGYHLYTLMHYSYPMNNTLGADPKKKKKKRKKMLEAQNTGLLDTI